MGHTDFVIIGRTPDPAPGHTGRKTGIEDQGAFLSRSLGLWIHCAECPLHPQRCPWTAYTPSPPSTDTASDVPTLARRTRVP